MIKNAIFIFCVIILKINNFYKRPLEVIAIFDGNLRKSTIEKGRISLS